MDQITKPPSLRKARLEKVEARISAITVPPLNDKNLRMQVLRYAEWLSVQSQRSVRSALVGTPFMASRSQHGGAPSLASRSQADAAREMHEYIESAGKTVRVGEKEVAIFAPFQPEHSALQTFTRRQIIALLVLAIAWLLGLLIWRQGMLITTIALVTLLYIGHLILNIGLALLTFGRKNEEEIDERVIHALCDADWPPYTILCPLYKEAQVVPQFVKAMSELSYPKDKLQILLLTEQDDRETRDAIRALNLPPHFQIVTVPDGKPRTKPRACNFGLLQATGQFVVIYDAEDIPEPLQLKKAVLTFANHGSNLACVQAKLNYYNPEQNILTRWFTAEYSLWFDLILPGLQRAGLSIPLGGTSNHFQIQTLRALGAWDAYNVTEDCDLGLRLARYRFDTVVLNSVTYEEANSQIKNWIRQRSRWIKGYMQTYLVYMRHPWRYLRRGHMREFISLQLVIGSKTGILFLNPLLWLSFALYFVFRPEIGHTFQQIYPKPLLYLSALSLFFGNFFYIYVYLLACVRRKQYRLVKWALFIPIYWMLMSVAACMALFQLIVKPHYWEKTVHGLHLRKNQPLDAARAYSDQGGDKLDRPYKRELQQPGRGQAGQPDAPTLYEAAHARLGVETADVETMRMPAFSQAFGMRFNATPKGSPGVVSSVTTRLRKLMTLPLPALSRAERQALQPPARAWWADFWLFGLLFIAINASIAACYYSYKHFDILLYNDAYAHLRIPLRVIDAHFSLAQFGGVWLPLPHILMLPFIWNTFLLRTGLAGSIPSMVCYIVATIFLYLSALRLTKNKLASFVGALVLVLNPNVLYLQTTPLSEPVCIATLTMACYFFLAWTQENHPKFLVLTAASTFLATMARYDGWMLCVLLPPLIVAVGLLKRRKRAQIEADVIIFCVFGFLGIVLWMVWCYVIFGDPLYFQHSQFSSQAQQALFVQTGTQYAAHNLIQSFRYYILNTIDVIGPLLFVLGVGAFASLVSSHLPNALRATASPSGEMQGLISRRKFTPEVIGALAFLAPFIFYVGSLYTGQVSLYVPEAVPPGAHQTLFNTRFGSEMVAPLGLFIAVLTARLHIPAPGHIWSSLSHIAFILIIITQSVLIVSNGIITVQDGQYGVSCAEYHRINIYLAQHYNGGKILEDIYSSDIDGIDAGLDYLDFVNESSGPAWVAALKNPTKVDWIIVRPQWLSRPGDQPDLVAQALHLNSAAFLTEFSLVVQEPTGLELYHRNGLAPLPTNPIPPGLSAEHKLCGVGAT